MRALITIAVLGCLVIGLSDAVAQHKPLDQQIAEAVSPLPQQMRDGATVLGYESGGTLTPIRKGTNVMVCLADDPTQEGFNAACYHHDLEPFMARGRELRAQGTTGLRDVNAVRVAEIESGKLQMPRQAAALFILAGDSPDAARPRQVIYMPYATAETTGISEQPSRAPWLMFPGTPLAHVMISVP